MTGHEVPPNTPVQIDVRRGDPTAEELAALIAVVREAYVTEAESAVVEDSPARSAWSHSQRGLREPLRRERGWVHG